MVEGKLEIMTKINTTGRPRPAIFRALGKNDPPPEIIVENKSFFLVRVFKHDSWAATALYQSAEKKKIVCKFNRHQPIFILPMSWLGRRLAAREAFFYTLFEDLSCIPQGYKIVYATGKQVKNAFAHDYIEGRPLLDEDRLSNEFYGNLENNLKIMHDRGTAYMDLHKRENIILGEDGNPYLIDFQVGFVSRSTWFLPGRILLKMFQKGDIYHLRKHSCHGLSGEEREKILKESRPLWIKVHRFFAQPLREMRRKFLVLIGIRKGKGHVQSEHFVEYGLSLENAETSNIIHFPTANAISETHSQRKTA